MCRYPINLCSTVKKFAVGGRLLPRNSAWSLAFYLELDHHEGESSLLDPTHKTDINYSSYHILSNIINLFLIKFIQYHRSTFGLSRSFILDWGHHSSLSPQNHLSGIGMVPFSFVLWCKTGLQMYSAHYNISPQAPVRQEWMICAAYGYS